MKKDLMDYLQEQNEEQKHDHQAKFESLLFNFEQKTKSKTPTNTKKQKL